MQWSPRFGRALRTLLILVLGAGTAGCYYMQAANGQWQVMRKREPIAEVLADDATSEGLAGRLRLVQAARQFSIDELALPDNDSYRSYADIEREFVVWNVFAAPEFSLQPMEWCFPVAGCVNYRGYFSRDAAYRESARLAKRGYDVAVGGVSAYSTLGKFDDPVLSSMMRWDDIQLVAVLFHELAHQVLYIKDDSAFNESFATAVEEFGVGRWLESNDRMDDIEVYRARRELRQNMMALVAVARDDLRAHFSMAVPDEEKRRLKAARLKQLSQAAGEMLAEAGREGSNWLGGELNNARLVSMTLYEGRLPAFRVLLADCAHDIQCFYTRAGELAGLDPTSRNKALDELAGRQPQRIARPLDPT